MLVTGDIAATRCWSARFYALAWHLPSVERSCQNFSDPMKLDAGPNGKESSMAGEILDLGFRHWMDLEPGKKVAFPDAVGQSLGF
jgi:hypothetical protein